MKRVIRESPFANTYGGLSLVRDEKNQQFFLEMEDCFGPLYFGPLTEEQTNAFHILCQVPLGDYREEENRHE